MRPEAAPYPNARRFAAAQRAAGFSFGEGRPFQWERPAFARRAGVSGTPRPGAPNPGPFFLRGGRRRAPFSRGNAAVVLEKACVSDGRRLLLRWIEGIEPNGMAFETMPSFAPPGCRGALRRAEANPGDRARADNMLFEAL